MLNINNQKELLRSLWAKHIQKLVVLDPLPRVFGCIDAVTQNKLVESRGSEVSMAGVTVMVWVSIMSLERLTLFGFRGFRIPFCLIEPSSAPLERNPKLPPSPIFAV